LIYLLLGAATIYAASASSILSKAAEKLAAAKSVSADYTVTADGRTLNGSITVAGEKFLIDSREIKSWFDGKTQWTYSSEIGEVNITEPTAEELTQVNPFAIINAFRSNFNARTVSETPTAVTIEMLPRHSGGDIKKVLLTLQRSTFFPSRIVITLSSGAPLTISIRSISEGMKLPDSYFRFTQSALPGVEVVDLR
ncbi:MAG: outer-membrane lipoprotein carrier protein LolA, partial [Duncaniella sp.]|nr:outer-membrane lipoprotein carrier protein LolA [Duncaniella sp.]